MIISSKWRRLRPENLTNNLQSQFLAGIFIKHSFLLSPRPEVIYYKRLEIILQRFVTKMLCQFYYYNNRVILYLKIILFGFKRFRNPYKWLSCLQRKFIRCSIFRRRLSICFFKYLKCPPRGGGVVSATKVLLLKHQVCF